MLLIWALHRWSYCFEGKIKFFSVINPHPSETIGPHMQDSNFNSFYCLHECLKAALDPCVKLHVEGVVLTSPAIHVQPSHPIIKVSTILLYGSRFSGCLTA